MIGSGGVEGLALGMIKKAPETKAWWLEKAKV